MLDTRYEDIIKQLLGSATGAKRSVTQPTTTPTYRRMAEPVSESIDHRYRGPVNPTPPTGEQPLGPVAQAVPMAGAGIDARWQGSPSSAAPGGERLLSALSGGAYNQPAPRIDMPTRPQTVQPSEDYDGMIRQALSGVLARLLALRGGV